MLKITIFYGCVRVGRQSIRAAKAVEQALQATGRAEVTFIDLKHHHLPVMEQRLKDMDNPSQNLLEISEQLMGADGILFITPEYNNSYSGALKNGIDYFTKEWHHKPIGIVCASDGKQGGINASNLLQLLVLAIDGFAMPTKLLVPEVPKTIDEEGSVLDEQLAKRLNKFITDYLWFVEAIADRKKKDGMK